MITAIIAIITKLAKYFFIVIYPFLTLREDQPLADKEDGNERAKTVTRISAVINCALAVDGTLFRLRSDALVTKKRGPALVGQSRA
jgi:hypothetical protein